jgi:hypothetical protein
MKKTENIFVKAKAYQKLHPRTAWAECIQKCKGKKAVSGARPAKVAGKPKVAGTKRAKRPRTSSHPVVSTKTMTNHAHSRIKRGTELLKEIDRLEAKAKEVVNKDLKHIYYAEINSLHARLNKLKKTA